MLRIRKIFVEDDDFLLIHQKGVSGLEVCSVRVVQRGLGGGPVLLTIHARPGVRANLSREDDLLFNFAPTEASIQ